MLSIHFFSLHKAIKTIAGLKKNFHCQVTGYLFLVF
jgi:hypothetical protein